MDWLFNNKFEYICFYKVNFLFYKIIRASRSNNISSGYSLTGGLIYMMWFGFMSV